MLVRERLMDRGEHVSMAWAGIREGLKRDCGARLFDHWLKPIMLAGVSDKADVVRLTLPTEFHANWVRAHYADRLLLAWRAAMPTIREVRIEVAPSDVVTRIYTADEAESVPAAPPAPGFDARQTFERFVVDDENRVACNAAKALAAGELRFSPLFIHSATGQGKTHLMNAIGAAYRARVPGAAILFMSAERFMVEFVSAMRDKDTLAFKQRLRSADLLMIDDVQFIAGKGSTQEEFLHTLNELTSSGKKVVISADRAPQALDGVETRILSRLASGLVVDIKPATFALRLKIVKAKLAGMSDVQMPEAVAELLAARIQTSVRELEGALNRLTAYALLNDRAIDLAFAQEVLGEMLNASTRRITIDEIQRAVSAHYGMRQAEMVSARRARAVARPRQIAMYLAKRLTPRSLPEIGRRFGGRDHTTVIHAVKQIERLRGEDADLDADVRSLIRQLEA
ncbi:chromosomal replication initiator protein DnaA [Sphingomonas sp. MAH-20]|uniref:Chromosomal replication initiator protein DnaA n=3 Tax=Sphingomonas TaxID=13687 RepID=A0A6I4J1V0_9SPHN|nr:chromosomal replication initiator protein DnaA [Sphingomonas horti]MBA2919383.1 chromosomal replication initiator protein DnaA [Sphingomonas sp. CGMCC 1.13658]MVO78264.1 chromosomal replication initiator protein DnaA [Sphingomonas horti]